MGRSRGIGTKAKQKRPAITAADVVVVVDDSLPPNKRHPLAGLTSQQRREQRIWDYSRILAKIAQRMTQEERPEIDETLVKQGLRTIWKKVGRPIEPGVGIGRKLGIGLVTFAILAWRARLQ